MTNNTYGPQPTKTFRVKAALSKTGSVIRSGASSTAESIGKAKRNFEEYKAEQLAREETRLERELLKAKRLAAIRKKRQELKNIHSSYKPPTKSNANRPSNDVFNLFGGDSSVNRQPKKNKKKGKGPSNIFGSIRL